MNIADTILIVLYPLFGALAVTVAAWTYKKLCFPIALIAVLGSAFSVFKTVLRVHKMGLVEYHLGGWIPLYGIHYSVDHLTALILIIIAVVSVLAVIYSYAWAKKEISDRLGGFYTLFLLSITGLYGITMTADAFNLYVLIEVAAFTSYGLMGLSGGRAALSTFNYLILGTVGACFYLLGVGYMFMKTGSLNMGGISESLFFLHGSISVFVAFIFVMLGLWIKMSFFPFHGAVPNVYAYSPTAVTCLLAPLLTKVYAYVMIRMMFSVFSADYVFNVIGWQSMVVFFSSIAIIMGSLYAVFQTDMKKILAYIVVAEIGYIVGGVWLANELAMTGALYHILSDALMMLTLFMAVGAIVYKTGRSSIDVMPGLFSKMPVTMGAFVIAALSIVGVPPTCGFFSKWYLISGAIQEGAWLFIVALLFSSLMSAIIFARIFEKALFSKPEEVVLHKKGEAPASMMIPLTVAAFSLVWVGVMTKDIVLKFIYFAIPIELI